MPKWMSEFTVPPDDKEGVAGIKFEDSGQAAIMYFPLDEMTDLIDEKASEGFFVRLHSWDETAGHTFFRSLMGRKVRVTIETT